MLSLSILAGILIIAIFFKRKTKSRFLVWVIVAAFNLLVVEGFAYGYLVRKAQTGDSFFLIGNQRVLDWLIVKRLIEFSYFDARNKYSIYRTDPHLGYTVAESKFHANFPATNSAGMRADREYDLIPPADTLRVATFGDSFVFCDDELTQNCWTYFLEKAIGKLEVLNFGVSGYGLGQSYLRYLKDGLKYHPDIIFFNYIDLTARDWVSFREIIGGRSLRNSDDFRARFWIEGNVLLSQAMTPLDLLYPAFRQAFIFDPLGLKEKSGIWANPVFSISNVGLYCKQIFWPRELQKRMHVGDNAFKNENIRSKMLENILKTAKSSGTTVIFLADAFNTLPGNIQMLLNQYAGNVVYVDNVAWNEILHQRAAQYQYTEQEMRNVSNHYSPKGNRVFAETMIMILASRSWGHQSRVFKLDPQTKAFANVSPNPVPTP